MLASLKGCSTGRASSREMASRSGIAAIMSGTSTTSAPSARQPSMRNGSAASGITIFACTPPAFAAQAAASAKLPPEKPTMPLRRASSLSQSIPRSDPRALNEPVCWNSSSFM